MQTAGEIRPADLADEVGVATHHELIAGTGQADVEAFAGAFERRLLRTARRRLYKLHDSVSAGS